MTHVIKCNSVDEALMAGLNWLHVAGVEGVSRNGRVLVSPEPVVTEYLQPRNRVLFNPLRDANPFFHLFEALWMLAGRNDVAFPARFAKQIAEFSDNGITVAGAYGERWRTRFGYDQLQVIIDELKKNPDSRRCVLTMWDAFGNGNNEGDLYLAMSGGKDVPCNTQAYFDTLGGRLNMTVTNRSNDIIWGCYGANAVHFSMLHEYVAASAGIELGVYRQFSNNYHMYADRPDVVRLFDNGAPIWWGDGEGYPKTTISLLYKTNQQDFDDDLRFFFGVFDNRKEFALMNESMCRTPYFAGMVVPLFNAHVRYKEKNIEGANFWNDRCAAYAPDWHRAVAEWLARRVK
jgi:hypothetical protein